MFWGESLASVAGQEELKHAGWRNLPVTLTCYRKQPPKAVQQMDKGTVVFVQAHLLFVGFILW